MNITPRAAAAAVICLAFLAATPVSAQQLVTVPSLDMTQGQAVSLTGVWSLATVPAGQRAPAMLLLHGCGGMYAGRPSDSPRRLAERMVEISQRLNAMGVHALALDSLTARGETELCTQRTGTRAVTQRNRRLDALGALQWLAAQPGVDTLRLGVMGWSNGGSTVLAATNGRRAEVRSAPVRASLAVAYYPGCESDLKAGYEATAPLLMLVGAEDDWTPPKPCLDLAAVSTGSAIQVESYAGAYHGFDGTGPVRHRKDVPNGVRPGQGVHVGGHPPSREAARLRMEGFVKQQWNLP